MAKKIRFALEMENGVEVRSLEELKNNFSLARVVGYLKDGKIRIWLRDRYADEIADEVEQLNLDDENFERKLCEIFDVSYDENMEKEFEREVEKLERIKRLKQITTEKKYLEVIDNVAFDQDELYDLLDDNVDTIYLCGERFSIPLSKTGVSYFGINEPTAVIDSKEEVNWEEKRIFIEGVIFDEKYKQIIDKKIEKSESLSVSANSKKKYYVEKRMVKYFFGNSELTKDVDSLIEVDMALQKEKIITNWVEDFFEYENYIYIVTKKSLGIGWEWGIQKYCKIDEKLQVMNVDIEGRDFMFGRSNFLNMGPKILPKERKICVTPNKILLTKESVAYSMDHDGNNQSKLTICGDPMTPITIYKDDFYYLNRSGRGNTSPLYRYNLYERKNEKLSDDTRLALYHGNYLYFETLSVNSGSNMFGWKILEVNLINRECKVIYIPNDLEPSVHDMRIENNRLQIKDYKTEKFFDIKTLEDDTE